MSSPEHSRKTFFVDPVVTSYEHVLVTRMLNCCNLPIVHFRSKGQGKDRKRTRNGKKQTSGQKKTKIYKKKKKNKTARVSTQDVYDGFVIFSNFSFLALPGDFWVAPKGEFSNSRQSLHVSGTSIADSNPSRDYGFLELSHPKPWIPESTPRISRIPDSKDFPKSAIRFTLHWGILWGFNLEKIDSLIMTVSFKVCC